MYSQPAIVYCRPNLRFNRENDHRLALKIATLLQLVVASYICLPLDPFLIEDSLPAQPAGLHALIAGHKPKLLLEQGLPKHIAAGPVLGRHAAAVGRGRGRGVRESKYYVADNDSGVNRILSMRQTQNRFRIVSCKIASRRPQNGWMCPT